jgi:hypothetical protein
MTTPEEARLERFRAALIARYGDRALNATEAAAFTVEVLSAFLDPSANAPEDLRWLAVITYRSPNGPIDVDHHFEEMGELHSIVERGPDWNEIERIEVRLNPARARGQ